MTASTKTGFRHLVIRFFSGQGDFQSERLSFRGIHGAEKGKKTSVGFPAILSDGGALGARTGERKMRRRETVVLSWRASSLGPREPPDRVSSLRELQGRLVVQLSNWPGDA